MPAMIPQNESPLNRAAMRALKQAGQQSWPESLYALQLAHWALETGKVKAKDPALEEYVETLLLRRTPEHGQRAILVQVEDASPEVSVDNSPGMSPEQLAAAILDNLSMSLAEQNPAYMGTERLEMTRAR